MVKHKSCHGKTLSLTHLHKTLFCCRQFKAKINGRPGLVVSGGSGRRNKNMTSVEFFDGQTGQWLSLPPLNRGRRSHVMTVTKGKLLVAGGRGWAGLARSSWTTWRSSTGGGGSPAGRSWTDPGQTSPSSKYLRGKPGV